MNCGKQIDCPRNFAQFQKKEKVKGGFLALKVDLQKTYDMVNWDFLKVVL